LVIFRGILPAEMLSRNLNFSEIPVTLQGPIRLFITSSRERAPILPAKLNTVTQIYAHRGLHVVARENTVASFEGAVALGVDGVELDVRRTVDGALVVHHDASVADLVISRTRQRDLPAYIPTLEQALEACAGVAVNVEIKNSRDEFEPTYDETGGFARQVVTHVREMNRTDSVIISCFDLETCCVVRLFDPQIRVGWLLWHVDLPSALTQAHVLEMSAVHPHHSLVDAAAVAAARELDLALNVWTVNAPSDIEAMAALGVDSIITDDPAEALALIRPGASE
jgi:glycerophosphoryl diester phosphodiesterase